MGDTMESYDGRTGKTTPIRFFLLDACSLVKLVLKEPGPGNEHISALAHAEHHQPQTTWLSLGECYGILKRKRTDKRQPPISDKDYLAAVYLLTRFVGPADQKPWPLVELAPVTFEHIDLASEVDKRLRKHPDLDFADALQLVAMLNGPLSRWGGVSGITLVTMDGGLKTAAAAEGLTIYDPDHDGYPPRAL